MLLWQSKSGVVFTYEDTINSMVKFDFEKLVFILFTYRPQQISLPKLSKISDWLIKLLHSYIRYHKGWFINLHYPTEPIIVE